MKVYIDSEFKCHPTNADGIYTEVESDFFDGMCPAFISGYRFIPDGASWTNSKGVVFQGEMIAPWKDFGELDEVQRKYEKQKLTEYNQVLQELGVEV